MDKANAALADYLIARGTELHLVGHRIAPEFLAEPLVTAHIVRRPLQSYFLGELELRRRARKVASEVTGKHAEARVVVNGGNCPWPDINWVHSVHHAWACVDRGAPVWFKLKNRVVKLWAKRYERRALRRARLVLANSEQTRRHLIERFGLPSSRVRTIYLGNDTETNKATTGKRRAAREWLGIHDERPLVAFAGALGYDNNKGFDTLCAAWQRLCERSDWDCDLLVAGAGNGVARWQSEIDRSACRERVRLLGFVSRWTDLLAAVDLLVSPVRYEAYGLNVQEAICHGVPALVSSRAGVVERYTEELREMILPDPEDVDDLVERLRSWRENVEGWKERFAPLSNRLGSYSWSDMAREIVSFVEGEAQTSESAQLEVEYLAG